MEPLKPRAKLELSSRPKASPQDVEEYERLLSERYTVDPNPDLRTQPTLEPNAVKPASEIRLETLYKKLYGNTP
jgi:hypothetical protein